MRIFAALLLASACVPETDLKQASLVPPGGASPSTLTTPDAGPVLATLLDPAPTSTGAPTNLRQIVLSFPEPILVTEGGGPRLVAGSGDPVALVLGQRLDCAGICHLFEVGAPLLPGTVYRVELPVEGVRFSDGKPIGPGVLGMFTTGAGPDAFAPRIQTFTVGIAEGCVVAHASADEPVRMRLDITGAESTVSLDAASFGLVHDLSRADLALPWGSQAVARALLFDEAGNQASSSEIPVLIPDLPPTVALVELLPNPAGSETTQEWVEILNFGEEAVPLGGLILADKAGSDVLPPHLLGPGERALIVGEAYDPADPKDVPPRDGTALVRVPGKLGGDGLGNTSDEVRLQSAKGQVISQYGGQVNTSATAWSGKALARTTPQACDGPGAWKTVPQAPTPGW